MSCEIGVNICAVIAAVTMTIQLIFAILARSEWWKNRGYELCTCCGRWRPKEEMWSRLTCLRCQARKEETDES